MLLHIHALVMKPNAAKMIRSFPSFGALVVAKYVSRVLWRFRVEWVGRVPEDPWEDARLIAVLHHTSLAEAIYLAAVPNRVLRRIAAHGVLPVAKETMKQPVNGLVFRLLVPNAVPITRRRDQSWTRVLSEVDDPGAMVALFPEGRMMRPNGRDKMGSPMRVRGGVAEVIEAIGTGRMILAYSGGLHHVFPPGAKHPRPFRTLSLRIESLDIPEYIAQRKREPGSFVDAVLQDLTLRRDLYTPIAPGTPTAVSVEVVRRRQRALAELQAGGGNGTANGADALPERKPFIPPLAGLRSVMGGS